MAFGRKNHVNLDPLSYSICLLGESKVGKSSTIYHMCEKLVGDDGYMFMELGDERGADAIEDINYINCPEWEMDEYDEEKPQNQVHRIIYKELYDKFLSFKDQKEEIKNEIDNLYIEAKNKYVQK